MQIERPECGDNILFFSVFRLIGQNLPKSSNPTLNFGVNQEWKLKERILSFRLQTSNVNFKIQYFWKKSIAFNWIFNKIP